MTAELARKKFADWMNDPVAEDAIAKEGSIDAAWVGFWEGWKAALAVAPTPPAQENQWQKAVLNECMAIEGCCKESDPVGTLTCLINWHVLNERDHASAPVAWRRTERDVCDEYYTAYHDEETAPAGRGWEPLYTRPDNDELRKAAGEVYTVFEHAVRKGFQSRHIDRCEIALIKLRTALGKK